MEEQNFSLADKLGAISQAGSRDDFSQMLERIRRDDGAKSRFAAGAGREQGFVSRTAQETVRAGQERDRKTGPADEPDSVSQLVEFFDQLGKKELGRIELGSDGLARLEELLLNSGYSQAEASEMLKLSLEQDNRLNLDTLAALVINAPPQGGAAFTLEASDRPLFIQVMQDLGVSPSDIDNYLAGAGKYGDKLLLRDIGGLLAQARENQTELSPAAAGRLQNLLGKLGLEKGEIEALLSGGQEAAPGVNAKSVFLMLEYAARKQDQHLAQQLREIMLQGGGGESRDTAAGEGARLRAQVINSQQYIENQVGENSPVSEIQASSSRKADSGGSEESLRTERFSLSDPVEQSALKTGRAAGSSDGDFSGQEKNQEKNQNGAKPLPAAGKILAGAGGVESVAKGNAVQAGGGSSVLPAYVVRQVAFSLGQMAVRHLDSLRLSLKPPSLGEISMELAVKDGAVKASLVTESVAAQKALEAGMDALKQHLAAQGVKVQQIEISVQPDAQRRQEQTFASPDRQRRQRQERQSHPDENNSPVPSAAAMNGRVNVRA
jgi:flagellar hook-length control protein FliK